VRAGDLAAHEAAELLLQRRQVRGHAIDFVQTDDADLGVFERDGGRHVLAVQHAVHADDFAGQVKACDLDLAGGVF
jgi:kynurenine formamidase